jgi:hypothetical protein
MPVKSQTSRMALTDLDNHVVGQAHQVKPVVPMI